MPSYSVSRPGILIGLFLLLFHTTPAWSSPNTSVASISVDGTQRTYLLHTPSTLDKQNPAPLLIALHGGLGNGRKMVKLTQGGLNALAQERGFLVVYPEGKEKHWNDGRQGEETGYSAHKNSIDDVGFISALIDKLVAEWNLDARRIYVTGMSNGSMMSHRLACDLSHKITAIAAVAGNLPRRYLTDCKPSRPLSVLVISNDRDPLMPYSGGHVTGPFGHKKLGQVLSATETTAFWSSHNRCSPSPVVTHLTDRDKQDGTKVRKETYPNCTQDTEVIHYAIENGGHTWPGGRQYLGEWLIGKTSRDINANQIIWHFFEQKSKR